MTPADGPFSRPNRIALIDRYFGDRKVSPDEAWKDVYRLLLWCDTTTGLAHCYESDKSQPGRPWYARTLAFHDWLGEQFDLSNDRLPEELDWMFKQVTEQVAAELAARRHVLSARAEEQRSHYDLTMPTPGDDPELRSLVDPLLPREASERPNEETIRDVLQKLRTHIANENKRKNLLGRGFEDVLAGVIARLATGVPQAFGAQVSIEEIPGFRSPRTGDKTEKVDLWVGPSPQRRVLVSSKWSIRADREKQMRGDFLTYVGANSLRDPFEFVWVTNEFDPARLVANATDTEANGYLLDAVVHVCPDALRVIHELERSELPRTRARLKMLLEEGRIISLEQWLTGLSEDTRASVR
jgi:hypothetical protein